MEVILSVPSREEMISATRQAYQQRIADGLRELAEIIGNREMADAAPAMASIAIAKLWPEVEATLQRADIRVLAAHYYLLGQEAQDIFGQLVRRITSVEFLTELGELYTAYTEDPLKYLGYDREDDESLDS